MELQVKKRSPRVIVQAAIKPFIEGNSFIQGLVMGKIENMSESDVERMKQVLIKLGKELEG
jgi:hypothetical protein